MPQPSLRSVNLNLLPILQSLLSTLNVTRSAEQLHMSQSAVSEALGKLRLQFRDDLLVRVGREMKPTPLALSLQGQLEQSMSMLEALMQSERFDPKTLSRRFIISTADTVMLTLAEPLIEQLSQEAPEVAVQFVDITSNVNRSLTAGEFDVLIMPGGFEETAGLYELPLYEDTFVGIARKNHPDITRTLNKDTYDALNHVAFRADHKVESSVETTLIGVNQRDMIRLPSFVLLPALVERSDALALIQKRAAEHFVDRYDIQIFDLPFKVPVVSHAAYWARIHDRDPAHQWFRTQLQQAAAKT